MFRRTPRKSVCSHKLKRGTLLGLSHTSVISKCYLVMYFLTKRSFGFSHTSVISSGLSLFPHKTCTQYPEATKKDVCKHEHMYAQLCGRQVVLSEESSSFFFLRIAGATLVQCWIEKSTKVVEVHTCIYTYIRMYVCLHIPRCLCGF